MTNKFGCQCERYDLGYRPIPGCKKGAHEQELERDQRAVLFTTVGCVSVYGPKK